MEALEKREGPPDRAAAKLPLKGKQDFHGTTQGMEYVSQRDNRGMGWGFNVHRMGWWSTDLKCEHGYCHCYWERILRDATCRGTPHNHRLRVLWYSRELLQCPPAKGHFGSVLLLADS